MIIDRIKNRANLEDRKDSKKQEPKIKVETFICGTCGSTMEILQDDLGHRKTFCKHCGNVSEVIDSDEERLEKATVDDKIREMQYKRDHPAKHMFKELSPFILGIGFMFLMVLYIRFVMI